MAKKKKNRPASAAPVAPAPKGMSSDQKIVAIGAAIVGIFVLFAWLGAGGSDEPRMEEDRSEHGRIAAPHDAPDPRLLHPDQLTERAPDTYAVEMETSEGTIVIDVHRDWAPNGADRFYNLVRAGFFTDVAFFRVLDGFMAQAGIHGRPDVARAWQNANIPDDPVVQHNTRGFVTFATAGPNTRTTQFFINFADNSRLDGQGFSPFGRVRDMAAVDRIEDRYGEQPSQQRIQTEGNAYLEQEFEGLTYIERARIL